MNVALRNPNTRPMTREEFFLWAERQEKRHEFDGSRPIAMTGGTNEHGIIADNIRFELMSRLRGGPCRSMSSDGGGVATLGNRVRYPEATVTCSPVPGTERLIPDPVVVFEVVSPSSVRTDQVVKLREYHAVLSIKRYVLVEQDGIALTVHARTGTEPWATAPLVDGDTLALPEIGIEIPAAALYEGVALDEATAPSEPTPG